MSVTTCQICARPIKSKSGLIAHHGYQRPGNGWQTTSCMGARHLPYEQSCDLIPVAIQQVASFIEQRRAYLTKLAAEPPATLMRVITGFGGRQVGTEDVPRPEGFDPATARRDYRFDSYVTLYFNRKDEAERQIKHAENDLGFLQKRLADWKAPEGSV